MAIKQRFRSCQVIGVDKPDVLDKAIKRGAIDEGKLFIAEAVRDADLIFIATPISSILTLLPLVGRYSRPQSIVTDVGSVKGNIVAKAERYFPKNNFIGGHPMAGVELSGVEAAHPLLFENAMYVLTPTKKTPPIHLKRLSNFLTKLGARVVQLDAKTHDEVASAVSHLPQLTAVALMNVVGKRHPSAKRHLQLAAGGFRDLTRIASSRFDIWQDILPANAQSIQASLRLLIDELRSYDKTLGSQKISLLQSRFQQSRRLRNSIPKNMKGFLHPLAEVYVVVKDQPGVLAKMTTALFKAKLNIKDMELLKIREGSGGTFRLAFDSKEIARKAMSVLRKAGFEVGE